MIRGRLLHLRWGRLLLRWWWQLLLRWWWQLLLRWLRRLRWRRWRFGHHLRRRWRWGLHRLRRDWRRHDRWCGPYKLMLRSSRHLVTRCGAAAPRSKGGKNEQFTAVARGLAGCAMALIHTPNVCGAVSTRFCGTALNYWAALGRDHQGRDHRASTAWVGAAAWQLTLPTSPIPGAALRISYRSSCLCPVISRRHPPIQLNGALIQDSPATWAVYGIKSARV